jgi:membrane protease YdiL (CAAX protease family)
LVVLLAVPPLVGSYDSPNATTQLVFAFTSVAVAFKEEVLYRGILQNMLEPRVGLVFALVVSNTVFALYHYGAQPFTLLSLTEIFTAGCILGLMYATSGSLMLVIAVHAVNDAIWSFTPLLSSPLPRPIGSALLIAALGLCVMWALRSHKQFQPTENATGVLRG